MQGDEADEKGEKEEDGGGSRGVGLVLGGYYSTLHRETRGKGRGHMSLPPSPPPPTATTKQRP